MDDEAIARRDGRPKRHESLAAVVRHGRRRHGSAAGHRMRWGGAEVGVGIVLPALGLWRVRPVGGEGPIDADWKLGPGAGARTLGATDGAFDDVVHMSDAGRRLVDPQRCRGLGWRVT